MMLMVVYSTLLFAARFLRLRDDQAGDNLYYLGFLFTLTSLGVSLYQFTAVGAAEEIVTNFGIAISTTILGVALRVIFNQMRQDPLEVERTARLELADAARKVRTELDETALLFLNFRRSMLQSAADADAEVREQLENDVGRIAKVIERLPKDSAEILLKAGEQASDSVERVSKVLIARMQESADKLESATDDLAAHARSINDVLDDVAQRLSTIQIPHEIAAERLDPLTRTLSEAIKELRLRHHSQLEIVRASIAAVEEATHTAAEVVEAYHGAPRRNSGQVQHAIGRIRQVMRDLARFIIAVGGDRKHEQVQLIDALERQEGNLKRIIGLLEGNHEVH